MVLLLSGPHLLRKQTSHVILLQTIDSVELLSQKFHEKLIELIGSTSRTMN